MARTFRAADQHTIEVTATILAVFPITMACWFRARTAASQETILCISDSTDTGRLQVGLRGDAAGDYITALSANNAGTNASAQTTVGYVAERWHHACGVWSASTNRAVYLDGGGAGSDTTTIAWPTPDVFVIGGRHISGAYSQHFDGDLAEVAIWSATLTEAEVKYLAIPGVRPTQVNPSAIRAYFPLSGQNEFFEMAS